MCCVHQQSCVSNDLNINTVDVSGMLVKSVMGAHLSGMCVS